MLAGEPQLSILIPIPLHVQASKIVNSFVLRFESNSAPRVRSEKTKPQLPDGRVVQSDGRSLPPAKRIPYRPVTLLSAHERKYSLSQPLRVGRHAFNSQPARIAFGIGQ
jgi:hypothetical protein